MMSRLPGGNFKKGDLIFFELLPFANLDFENQDNSKSVIARCFRLGQLKEDDQ